jgi:hypothetical protein
VWRECEATAQAEVVVSWVLELINAAASQVPHLAWQPSQIQGSGNATTFHTQLVTSSHCFLYKRC